MVEGQCCGQGEGEGVAKVGRVDGQCCGHGEGAREVTMEVRVEGRCCGHREGQGVDDGGEGGGTVLWTRRVGDEGGVRVEGWCCGQAEGGGGGTVLWTRGERLSLIHISSPRDA